ncbi:MAG: hypothetical protein JRD89_15585 [Deltaproteobacteria bacterium]|nr:hypothetical protein [Deltaproteobacteria bacterium]
MDECSVADRLAKLEDRIDKLERVNKRQDDTINSFIMAMTDRLNQQNVIVGELVQKLAMFMSRGKR